MSVLGLPHEHFASKWKLARQEISDDTALVALAYHSRTGSRGIVIGYWTRDDTPRHKELTSSISICGAGNYGDFIDLLDNAHLLVGDFIKLYGETALSINIFRKDFARYIRDVWRLEPKAFGVELLVIEDRPEFEMPKMLRIRPNGKDHPCNRFGIIGGYRPPNMPESQISPRKALRQFLEKNYPANNVLSRKEAEELVIQALRRFAFKDGWTLRTYYSRTPNARQIFEEEED